MDKLSNIFWKVLSFQFRHILERRGCFPYGHHKEKKEGGCSEGAGISEFLAHAPQSHFHTLEKQIQTERLLTMLWATPPRALREPALKVSSQLCRNELTCHPARETNPRRHIHTPQAVWGKKGHILLLKSIPRSCFLVPNFRASLGLTVTI